MEELTAGQREPLFELVRYQRDCRKESVFAACGGWDVEIQSWDKRAAEEEPIVRVPTEVLELWRETGYVAFSERGIGSSYLGASIPTFVLKQASLDYDTFMRNPEWIRWIIKLWLGVVGDMLVLVGGIVGGVVSGVIGAVVTVIILNRFGLAP